MLAFAQSLSGLQGASTGLDVIGNNLANASTVGFKQSRAEFADVFSTYLKSDTGSGASVPAITAQFNQGTLLSTDSQLDFSILGAGMFMFSDEADNQEIIGFSRNGDLQFKPIPAAEAASPWGEKYVVNANGNYLLGWAEGVASSTAPTAIRLNQLMSAVPTTTSTQRLILDDGAPATAVPNVSLPVLPVATATAPDSTNAIAYPLGTADPAYLAALATYTSAMAAYTSDLSSYAADLARAGVTSEVPATPVAPDANDAALYPLGGADPAYQLALADYNTAVTSYNSTTGGGVYVFSPSNPASFNWSSNQTIYSGADGDQTPHVMTLYFARVDNDTWNVYSELDRDATTVQQVSQLVFSPTGMLTTGGQFSVSGTITGYSEEVDPLTGIYTYATGTFPMSIGVDLTGTALYATGFEQGKMEQDGYNSGLLDSISMSEDGTIVGSFSNQKTKELAQVALANFENLNGLQSRGDYMWMKTEASGEPKIGIAGQGGFGKLSQFFLEQSNVEISNELIDMVVQQRNYQANAQMIKTQDEMLKTLAGLR